MSEHIRCRDCPSPDCRGCNIYILATMLELGRFEPLMDGNRAICSTAQVERSDKNVGREMPLPPIGKWECEAKDDVYILYRCSVCDYRVFDHKPKFCPNCGAYMEGAQE